MMEVLTLIVSLIALAVSIVSTIYSFRLQSLDSERTTREQLNSVISELIKINAENNAMSQVPIATRDFAYYQKTSTITQVATALSRQAVYLVKQQKGIVTDVEYVSIAQGLVLSSDIQLADKFYLESIKSAPSKFFKVTNTRMYAGFLFSQGRHEQGRDFYQDALGELNNDTDFNKYTNGYTYHTWMASEGSNGFWEEAEEKYYKAKRLFGSISNPFIKDNSITYLDKGREIMYQFSNVNKEASVLAANPSLAQPNRQFPNNTETEAN